MANINNIRKWEAGIYQYEITDPLQSGPDGIDNLQGKQLGNRTVFLKDRVDRLLQGYSYAAVRPRVASTINVSIQAGGLVEVDGVTVAVGDAVLLKAQTDPVENGIYIAATGAWGRASQYANGSQNVFDSVMVDIKEGETYGGKIFMLDALQDYIIGTDALTFRETIFSYEGLPGKVLVHDRSGDFSGGQKLGGYLTAHDFGTAAPTQQELTDYALEDIGITDRSKIFNGTRAKNLFDNHVWILANTPNTNPPVFWWSDDGQDVVGVATDTELGIVKGSTAPDGVTVLSDGSLRVNGGGSAESLPAMVDGYGRNLMTVLGKQTIIDTMAEIVKLSNNTGQLDNTGIPNYSAMRVGDYIDGIDLSGIAAENSGSAGQAWSDGYKNNRIVIAGFNTYKGAGDTENTKNHVLFTFRNCPLAKRMNSSNDNTGGYQASELRAFLEGLNGDGTGDKSGVTTARFMTVLKQQIGDVLYKIRKAHSNKGGYNWANYTCFIPTELEVFGYQTWGDEANMYNTNVQWPLYAQGYAYRVKRYNGARQWWWEHTPYSGSAASFSTVHSVGDASYGSASSVGGCAPAFCVA
jgi:hypothetical protein